MPKIIRSWGIDIGHTALKAVCLESREGEVQAVDAAVISYVQPLPLNGADGIALVNEAIGALVSQHGKVGSAAIAIPGGDSFVRFASLPPVDPAKFAEIAHFEAMQQFPFPLDEAEYGHVVQEANREVRLVLAAVRKSTLSRYILPFEQHGFRVTSVNVAPLATYNSLIREVSSFQGTTLFLDVGAVSTTVIISDGPACWLRVCPIGGNDFTQAIARTLKVSFARAEQAKIDLCKSKMANVIVE